MAGPALGIVIDVGSCSAAEAIAILQSHVDEVETSASGAIDFSVSTTSTIGGRYRGERRPFILSAEPMTFDDTTDVEIRGLLGGRTSEFLVVSAMCNSPEDHRILAEVTAFLAFRLQAWVQLESHGALPQAVLAAGRWLPIRKAPAATHEEYLVDHQILGAWARHDKFALVK